MRGRGGGIGVEAMVRVEAVPGEEWKILQQHTEARRRRIHFLTVTGGKQAPWAWWPLGLFLPYGAIPFDAANASGDGSCPFAPARWPMVARDLRYLSSDLLNREISV